ncbi:hypothetical protein ACFFX0_17775 [Citricoccus parietis]|uniref:Uncharacterized protein n=1 Tax=Citricoccus parietis TaxID=592307 RepID=A0ABV5G1Z3_9MICC
MGGAGGLDEVDHHGAQQHDECLGVQCGGAQFGWIEPRGRPAEGAPGHGE